MEVVKHNSHEYSFVGPKKFQAIGKKYNNQIGMQFHMNQIKIMTKKEKKQLASTKKAENQGSDDDHQRMLAMCRKHSPSRKKLLIREKSCKESPFASKRLKADTKVRCPVPRCPKVYVYEAALATHLHSKHTAYLDLEKAQADAKNAFDIMINRVHLHQLQDSGSLLTPIPELELIVEEGQPSDDIDQDEADLEPHLPEVLNFDDSQLFPTPKPVDFEGQLDPDETLTPTPTIDLSALLAVNFPFEEYNLEPPVQQAPSPLEKSKFHVTPGVTSFRPILLDFEINNFTDLEAIEVPRKRRKRKRKKRNETKKKNVNK